MRRALVALAIGLAIVGAVATRIVLAGRDALAEGDALAAAGHPREAIAAWQRAARWYLPGAPHVDAAYVRLATAAAAADPATAAAAWRAIRGAALATRHLWSPHDDDRARADAALAHLAATTPGLPAEDTGAGATEAARTTWHAARLARDPGPGPGATRLALLGLLALLGGLVVLARGAIDAAGHLRRRPALVGAAFLVAGAATWALGLYYA